MTTIRDLRLHVRHDEGEGPVIVLLHGINSNAASWRTVIDAIGPEYRVIAPDLLGFGESPKPDIEYAADQHSAVLEATLRDLCVTERFVLVGYSMGGNVAIRYAATHPERLRRLFRVAAGGHAVGGGRTRRCCARHRRQVDGRFGVDGVLSGSGGCNRLNSGYTLDGTAIKLGPFMSTRMACAEPTGVMEQEAALVAALESAATVSVEGDNLDLQRADGATAARLKRG